MKTSEQIVVVGGPYRSLSLENRRRRVELTREIAYLENGLKTMRWWLREGFVEPVVVIVAETGLCFITAGMAKILVGPVVATVIGMILFVLHVILWIGEIRFCIYVKRHGRPENVLKQKLTELAELPPE